VINRRDAIQPAFDALLGVTDQVLAMDQEATERAKEIIMGHPVCPRETRCTLRSWKSMKSTPSSVSTRVLTDTRVLSI
jgi:hypothetical protein